MEIKVKICGMTRTEDIEAVNRFLPDYVGFVFAPSRRMVSPEKAAELISNLDKRIKKVGVFVNHSENEVKRIAEKCSLDVLQFHGNETSQYCSRFKHEIWKALGINDTQSLDALKQYCVDGILLDTVLNGVCGGTGQTFDWSIAEEFSKEYRIILAGGLNQDNVIEAISKIKPFCVDVSSGVESKGIKDPAKIYEFIKAAKSGEVIR